MSTKTVTIGPDGSTMIVKQDFDEAATISVPGGGVHRSGSAFDPASFITGVIVGMIVLLLLQRLRRNRLHRSSDFAPSRDDARGTAGEVAALARRTATLETIVTDPGQRTAREIDALR